MTHTSLWDYYNDVLNQHTELCMMIDRLTARLPSHQETILILSAERLRLRTLLDAMEVAMNVA